MREEAHSRRGTAPGDSARAAPLAHRFPAATVEYQQVGLGLEDSSHWNSHEQGERKVGARVKRLSKDAAAPER